MKKITKIKRRSVSSSQEWWVATRPLLDAWDITTLVEPKVEGLELVSWARNNTEFIEQLFWEKRALLFRGFDSGGIEGFQAFVEATSKSDRLTYKDRSTPRNSYGDRIYNATVYPPEQSINLHNEGSYWRK